MSAKNCYIQCLPKFIKEINLKGCIHNLHWQDLDDFLSPLRWEVYFKSLCRIVVIWITPSSLLVNVFYERPQIWSWNKEPNWTTHSNQPNFSISWHDFYWRKKNREKIVNLCEHKILFFWCLLLLVSIFWL